jgi:hypothetical protein
VQAEWIMLHDNPDFRGFVDVLRAELDRIAPAVPRKLFQEILSLIARLQRHALQHEGFGVECSEALTASSVRASCRSTTRSVRDLLRTPHR